MKLAIDLEFNNIFHFLIKHFDCCMAMTMTFIKLSHLGIPFKISAAMAAFFERFFAFILKKAIEFQCFSIRAHTNFIHLILKMTW